MKKDYKKYLNGLRNGIGKEYENNILIFEGEYLNGKRNGIGKVYKNNKLINICRTICKRRRIQRKIL